MDTVNIIIAIGASVFAGIFALIVGILYTQGKPPSITEILRHPTVKKDD